MVEPGSPVRFTATIELGGKTATGFEVPAEVVARLGPSRRPAVRVTVGGHTYASTIAVMGGRSMLPLSAENRAAAGVSAGDQVEVGLVPDLAPRTVDVPEAFAAGADYIVVGRPIRQAADPVAAAETIQAQIAAALAGPGGR